MAGLSYAELRPYIVDKLNSLRRADPKTGKQMSLRKISTKFAEATHLNERGRPFNPRGNGLDYKHCSRRLML